MQATFDRYIQEASLLWNKQIKCFVLTIEAFKEWYVYCEEHNMDMLNYKDIPIVVNKKEHKLNIVTILIQEKDEPIETGSF